MLCEFHLNKKKSLNLKKGAIVTAAWGRGPGWCTASHLSPHAASICWFGKGHLSLLPESAPQLSSAHLFPPHSLSPDASHLSHKIPFAGFLSVATKTVLTGRFDASGGGAGRSSCLSEFRGTAERCPCCGLQSLASDPPLPAVQKTASFKVHLKCYFLRWWYLHRT